MRSTRIIPLAAALGLCLSLPILAPLAQADGRANRPDVLSVKDVKKGMKGYGLTVFEGTTPERFEVEVIDVLQNFKPRQEMILIKTKHPRLDVTKIVGGMSGSPIYLQGKMVGAYAYGWTFGVEPVAGVTPIRSMLDDLERPLPKMLHGYPLGILPKSQKRRVAQSDSGRFQGDFPEYSLERHAAQLAVRARGGLSNGSQLVPVSTPLLLGGMTEEAVSLAEKYLAPLGLLPLQAGGGGTSPARAGSAGGGQAHYVDGGAIGVNLVGGDLSAMGLGTVTRVEGDRLVAFGHPMMNIGITSLPTTRARILWFMASQMRSFKMGESTGVLGALVNDRQSSIVADESIEAPVVQVSLGVKGEPGAPYEDWQFQVAHDRFLTPALLGVALGSGLGTTAAERRNVTWSMDSTIEFDGFPPISIEDFGSSPAGTPSSSQVMQSNALLAIGKVLNNPWQAARLKNISVDVKLKFAREVSRLIGVELLTPEVDPGGVARLRITLEPYSGAVITRMVSVSVAKRFAGETLKFSIRPGYEVEPERAAPNSLAELIANLEAGTKMPRSLVISHSTGEGGVAYRGVVAKHLPPGALDTLTSTSSSFSPQQFGPEHHQVVPLSLYVVGSDSVSVKVRDSHR